MAQFDDVTKNQIAAVLRVINYSKCFKEDNVPCHIEEGLFLGSVGAAKNKNALKRSNISHILTVANSIAPVYPNDFVYKVIAGEAFVNLLSCSMQCMIYGASRTETRWFYILLYEEVPDREETNLRQYFEECINFIDEAKRQGGAVLVHCFVGRSRSVTIILAYLMKKHGMTVSQALEYVKSRRPQASPNSGFILQLQEYERFLKDNSEKPLSTA
ncbi:Dual specificity protein phosphatase 1 [Linum perenne]